MIINGNRVHISLNPITKGEKSISFVVIGRDGSTTRGAGDTLPEVIRSIVQIIVDASTRKFERKAS